MDILTIDGLCKRYKNKEALKDVTYSLGEGRILGLLGPNGSGKSNITDAVRWVLGEMSTKNIRGSKMEDVIFGGTSQRKALGYAEVTLRLDNTDRSLNGNISEPYQILLRLLEPPCCVGTAIAEVRDARRLLEHIPALSGTGGDKIGYLVKLIEEIEASIKEGQDITLEIERLRSAISDSEEQAAVIVAEAAALSPRAFACSLFSLLRLSSSPSFCSFIQSGTIYVSPNKSILIRTGTGRKSSFPPVPENAG